MMIYNSSYSKWMPKIINLFINKKSVHNYKIL